MLSLLTKRFRKASAETTAAMAKNMNRDLMEGTVYGAFYVAGSDGSLGDSEIKKLEKIIANQSLLKGFGAELSNSMDTAEALYNDSPRLLRQRAEKELSDLQHDPEAAKTVMNILLTIADEGGIDEAERAALERCAKWMGVNLKDFED
ncbi:tellurite resistance protein [Pseudomonas phage nickie]|uniref:Tellurite resistance protein n=1 Tax=Pseudomonas phage nickie TaxID=2048977 RepID=A0A2H4P7E3_9CAUD|nr:tellurite resistance [Pseudomonas phage nickie]ATW58095.1 tellurite resistance protein [Pseudomonas phage nickie]